MTTSELRALAQPDALIDLVVSVLTAEAKKHVRDDAPWLEDLGHLLGSGGRSALRTALRERFEAQSITFVDETAG